MASLLVFFYINLSAFHGDGTVVWMRADGHCVVQRATREHNQVWELQLPDRTLRALTTSLGALRDPKVQDRPGIPDEVRMHLGFRHATEALTKVSLWENDLPRQSADLKALRDIAQQLIALTAHAKPTRELHGALKVERPAGFPAADIDAALAP